MKNTESNPQPFRTGDRVTMNRKGTLAFAAPQTSRLHYVTECLQINSGTWLVKLAGMPGFKPRGGVATGEYNADCVQLVCRDPAREMSR